jgi:hypothetical protein
VCVGGCVGWGLSVVPCFVSSKLVVASSPTSQCAELILSSVVRTGVFFYFSVMGGCGRERGMIDSDSEGGAFARKSEKILTVTVTVSLIYS